MSFGVHHRGANPITRDTAADVVFGNLEGGAQCGEDGTGKEEGVDRLRTERRPVFGIAGGGGTTALEAGVCGLRRPWRMEGWAEVYDGVEERRVRRG